MEPYLSSALHREALRNYFEAPIVLPAEESIASGVLRKVPAGFELDLRKIEALGQRISVSRNHFYDLLGPTMMGLNEALLQGEAGAAFREPFELDFARWMQQCDELGEAASFGSYVYYPYSGHIVQYAPPYWHHLALLASNSRLMNSPSMDLSWDEVRTRLRNLHPAIAGASVGSKIGDTFIKLCRPDAVTIADFAAYKPTNANRTDIAYDDIVLSKAQEEAHQQRGFFRLNGMQNKAISFAKRMHRIDPFVQIYPIQEGITRENVREFVSPASVIIEEVDVSIDIEAKIFIREESREQGKMFIMLTDLGSAVQWDIRPFHLHKDIPLTSDCSDSNLRQLNQESRKSRDAFFNYMDAFIGNYYRQTGELNAIMSGKIPSVVSSIPQLGSSTSIASGLAAELSARMALGFVDVPERGILDVRNYSLFTSEKRIGDVLG